MVSIAEVIWAAQIVKPFACTSWCTGTSFRCLAWLWGYRGLFALLADARSLQVVLAKLFLRPETGFSVWLVPHKICTAASADQWSSRLLIDWSCFRPWAIVQFMCRVLKFDSSIPRRFSQAVKQSGVWMGFLLVETHPLHLAYPKNRLSSVQGPRQKLSDSGPLGGKMMPEERLVFSKRVSYHVIWGLVDTWCIMIPYSGGHIYIYLPYWGVMNILLPAILMFTSIPAVWPIAAIWLSQNQKSARSCATEGWQSTTMEQLTTRPANVASRHAASLWLSNMTRILRTVGIF